MSTLSWFAGEFQHAETSSDTLFTEACKCLRKSAMGFSHSMGILRTGMHEHIFMTHG